MVATRSNERNSAGRAEPVCEWPRFRSWNLKVLRRFRGEIIKCLSEICRYVHWSDHREVIELFDLFLPMSSPHSLSLSLSAFLFLTRYLESQVSGSFILSSYIRSTSETHRRVLIINHATSLISVAKSRFFPSSESVTCICYRKRLGDIISIAINHRN